MNNPSDLHQIPSEVYEVAISGLLHAEAEDGCQMNGNGDPIIEVFPIGTSTHVDSLRIEMVYMQILARRCNP